ACSARRLSSSWQNMLRRKLFTVINVAGLTAAIASSVIIFLYARHELSFDAVHANAERIQLVYKERRTATGFQELDDTWVPLLDLLKQQVPGIADGARVFSNERTWVELDGSRKFSETLTYADPAILELFTLPLARGDRATALSGSHKVVLSAEAARRFFGNDDPIGRTLTINFNDDYTVTGVLAPVPRNSTLRPDLLVPFENLLADAVAGGNSVGWEQSFLQTFVLLEQGANAAVVQDRLPAVVASVFGEEGTNGTRNMSLKFWSLRSLHDRDTNSNMIAWVLLGIALSIILVATINFMNLSIARSLERAKEVGVRKTMGSLRRQLVLLFFLEPLLISLFALALGVEMARFLLPMFNGWYGLDLALQLGSDPLLLTMLAAVGLAAVLLSGCYPALVLSGFKPAATLKGNLKSSPTGMRLRNGLTLLQFTVAIVLVTGIASIWLQVRYLQSRQLNFEPENVIAIPLRFGDFADRELATTAIETFKNELRALPGVASVASSMSIPGDYNEANIFAQPEGWAGEEPLRMLIAPADENYFATYGMSFVEGENFRPDTGTAVAIINETAARAIGWDSAVGKRLNDWTVVGVVKDFHYQSPAAGIRPIIHVYNPAQRTSPAHYYVSVKFDTPGLGSTLAAIEAQWRRMDPSRSFDYFFVGDLIAALYRDVNNAGKVLAWFAVLSIVIANLGLLGLSSYSVVQRTREIGIRKVFGGETADVALLLTAQFVRPVLLANLLAWPLAWIAITRWLESFAYHMELNWLIFPAGGFCILLLALLTVSLQSAKAAAQKPVLALRYE
ncbi:MAG: ABC transporter permease, partial [Pseudomonadota bacterium]|nr:ABC transporter permease [Pseudomonadota bacterium]